MTPIKSHLLTSAITAIVTAGITYLVLTSGDTSIPEVDPDTYRTEGRMIEREEQLQPKAVKDSLEDGKRVINERDKVSVQRSKKMQQMERERVNKADSLLAYGLLSRIKQWRP